MTAPAELRGEGDGREERQADDTEFHLPGNPRELRVLHALLAVVFLLFVGGVMA